MITNWKKSWMPLIVLVLIVVFVIFGSFYGFDFFKTRAPASPEPGCVVLQDRGQYEDSIDIVFLAENYNDVNRFLKDSEVFMNSFLQVEPNKEYRNRFNFFRIESLGLDLGCTYENDAVVCDPVKVKNSALDCPYDYPVVLVETKGIKNFFRHLRSSSWRGIASVNSADDPLVFVHESGHQMFGLLDEYTWQGGTIFMEGPNCDPQANTCPKFQKVEGSECHIGCVNNEHSRSIAVGIMRNYWESNVFGIFNEFIIEQAILEQSIESQNLELSPNLNEFTIQPPSEVDIITYSCNPGVQEEISCEILSVVEGKGYVSDSFDDGLIISNEDIRIGISYGDISNILILEGIDPETGEMNIEYKLSRFEDVVVLPHQEEEGEIVISTPDGQVLDSFNYIPISQQIFDSQKSTQIISTPVTIPIYQVT